MLQTKNNNLKKTASKILLSLVMWVAGILMILPFLWMISSSFKDPISMFRFPIEWIPNKFNFQSYKDIWASDIPFTRFYLNSIFVSIMAVIGTFISCPMAAYGYAKIQFPGRDKLFMLKLSTTMIPAVVTLLPTFLIYKYLGLTDKYAALWLPAFFGGTFGVFLMRQYFIAIPDSLLEAAKIDGCGHWRIYWQIVMPISKTAIATLLFLYFTWTWNDYEKPLIYLRSESKFTLPLALKYLSDENYTNYSAIMAAAVSSSIPIITLFIGAQKYFVEGIAQTGLKT